MRTPSAGDQTASLSYTVVRSARRRKTIELRVEASGRVVVLAPPSISEHDLDALVAKREAWIRERIQAAAIPAGRRLESGDPLPFLGEECVLHLVESQSNRIEVRLSQGNLRLALPASIRADRRSPTIGRVLEAWYRAQASEHLSVAVARWAKVVGTSPSKVLIRDPKRRWGSCSSDGSVRLNWRLVMAKPGLIDYVVVHELCHLKQPNHSPAFWAEVASALPDYKQRLAELRRIGPGLTI